MNIRIKNELIPIDIIVVMLVLIIAFFPDNALRIVLGLPFAIFFPGYVLLAALFPRKDSIGVIERIALSFGMSIAIVPLIGLALNYTPWGIRLEPVLYTVSSFIFVTSIIAWWRRRRLAGVEKFTITLQMRLPGWGRSVTERILSVALALAVIGALGTLIYVVANPKTGERFTEFFILGPEGRMENYPREVRTGEPTTVTLGIANHEHEPATYRIEITIDGQKGGDLGPITIEHEEEWAGEANFTPVRAGENQKAEFLLFKEGVSEPYRSLHLWLDVR